jgi:hypothetical protein
MNSQAFSNPPAQHFSVKWPEIIIGGSNATTH